MQIKEGDLGFVEQLVGSMAEAVGRLEDLKQSGKREEFEATKNFIIRLSKKINSEIGN